MLSYSSLKFQSRKQEKGFVVCNVAENIVVVVVVVITVTAFLETTILICIYFVVVGP